MTVTYDDSSNHAHVEQQASIFAFVLQTKGQSCMLQLTYAISLSDRCATGGKQACSIRYIDLHRRDAWPCMQEYKAQ